MSQPESSLDSLKAKCFSKKSAKLHFWCAHSTSLPMLAKRCPHQCSGKPPACKEHTKIHREKKRFFGSQKRRCSPFLGFSPFAFRSFRCLTARLDISVSSSFYVVFRKLRLQCFPRILCRMHRLVTQMARPCSDVKNARFHGIRTQKWKTLKTESTKTNLNLSNSQFLD